MSGSHERVKSDKPRGEVKMEDVDVMLWSL